MPTHSEKVKSTKLWVTVGSLVAFIILLWNGKLTGAQFESLYPLVLASFFGANVFATYAHENSKTSVIKAQGEQNVTNNQ